MKNRKQGKTEKKPPEQNVRYEKTHIGVGIPDTDVNRLWRERLLKVQCFGIVRNISVIYYFLTKVIPYCDFSLILPVIY